MSTIYHVMGAIKCPKIKKHSGIKLRPVNKGKESYLPNDLLIYTCESTEQTQSIRCRDDGSWSDIPQCPDPANFTCPDLEPIPHGFYSSTSNSPYKVGTTITFGCENELVPSTIQSNGSVPLKNTSQEDSSSSSSSLPPPTTLEPQHFLNFDSRQNITSMNTEPELRYNLTGHRQLKCLASSKWNHPVPSCSPVHREPPSNAGFFLATFGLILIPILILAVLFHLFIRWRKRQLQQERWKQYFTDYKYRHSKTSITFSNRPNSQIIIPVTDL